MRKTAWEYTILAFDLWAGNCYENGPEFGLLPKAAQFKYSKSPEGIFDEIEVSGNPVDQMLQDSVREIDLSLTWRLGCREEAKEVHAAGYALWEATGRPVPPKVQDAHKEMIKFIKERLEFQANFWKTKNDSESKV